MPLKIEDIKIDGPIITHPQWPEPRATFYLKLPDGQVLYYSRPLHMDYTDEDLQCAIESAEAYFRARVGRGDA